MNRDAIDFGTMRIPQLFAKMFVPTLLGMLLSASMNIADGAFVGHGAGSDALAAINIVAPFFLITQGVGLMFGCGVSIVAAVHLARGNRKAANINITQSFTVAMCVMVLLAAVVMLFPSFFARIMGSSDRLLPLTHLYMRWVIPCMPFGMVMSIGLFVIRLDGSPIYAMLCNSLPALLNMVGDYIFIFQCGMGVEGASLATGLCEVVAALMVAYYMFFRTQTIALYRPKFSSKALRLTLRNVGYHIKLGASSILGELAIACTMLTGNHLFIHYLGEDGVAAFSIVCYCFPLVFMVGNAIAQSAQPMLSHNYGAGLMVRVKQIYRLSLGVALVLGLAITAFGVWGSGWLTVVFLSPTTAAYGIAAAGLPYFAIAFVLITLNLVYIGYYQSLELYNRATLFTLLRGFIFAVPSFVLLPLVLLPEGLWLAVPLAELLTLLAIVVWHRIPYAADSGKGAAQP